MSQATICVCIMWRKTFPSVFLVVLLLFSDCGTKDRTPPLLFYMYRTPSLVHVFTLFVFSKQSIELASYSHTRLKLGSWVDGVSIGGKGCECCGRRVFLSEVKFVYIQHTSGDVERARIPIHSLPHIALFYQILRQEIPEVCQLNSPIRQYIWKVPPARATCRWSWLPNGQCKPYVFP